MEGREVVYCSEEDLYEVPEDLVKVSYISKNAYRLYENLAKITDETHASKGVKSLEEIGDNKKKVVAMFNVLSYL